MMNQTIGLNRYLQDIVSKNRRIHILFKCTQVLSKIDHILSLKTGLNKFKRIEIISSIFSSHSGMKLEIIYINCRKKNRKRTDT